MELNSKKVKVEISTNTIIKILIVIFLLWLLYMIKDIVAILFVALILVSVLEPVVGFFTRRRVPKSLAVLIILLILLALLALIVVLLIPPISEQINQLVESFPVYWENVSREYGNIAQYLNNYGLLDSIQDSLNSLRSAIPETTSNLVTTLGNFLTGVFSLIIIIVITFYFLVEEKAIKRILRSIIPTKYLPYSYQLFNRVQEKLGLWLRAQLILGFIIFVLVYLALTIFGIKYALILAIIAGLLEFVPYLGPFLSGFIAFALTLFQSPFLALLVIIIYLVVQFFENHVLVPLIMKKAVGLNPVVSIVALLIGAKLGGFIGVVLAIPVATVVMVVVRDFLEKKKETEMQLEK